jgi:hypothetical protein
VFSACRTFLYIGIVLVVAATMAWYASRAVKDVFAFGQDPRPVDILVEEGDTSLQIAQKLYEKLTGAGYKVFFSRITLEDKVGTEYEPYIYAALYSSKVMLTVSSSCENLEAVWVKNEWSRFLGFRQNDNTKTMLPLYFDMDKADLPEEFALLSAYDMSVDGFEDELLRGIKKLIPMSIIKAERKKIATKVVAFSLADQPARDGDQVNKAEGMATDGAVAASVQDALAVDDPPGHAVKKAP